MSENGYTYKKMRGLKIITALLYIAVIVWIGIFVHDILQSSASGDSFGYGLGIAFMLIFGLYGHVPSAVFTLVGLIVSSIRYKKGIVEKRTRRFFATFLFLIILSCVGLFVLAKALS